MQNYYIGKVRKFQLTKSTESWSFRAKPIGWHGGGFQRTGLIKEDLDNGDVRRWLWVPKCTKTVQLYTTNERGG